MVEECQSFTSTQLEFLSHFIIALLPFKLFLFFREKIFSNTNLLETRHIQRENSSLLADVRRSKAPLLKLPKSVTKTRPTEMRTR